MIKNTLRTIAVTGRSRSRLSRLRVRYPDRAPHPAYDTALARELLAFTGELPDSKHALVVLLTEYRHALYALAYPPVGYADSQCQVTTAPHNRAAPQTEPTQH
jgi:hypothetical protein